MQNIEVDNLKGILTVLKQPVSGSKDELVKRIRTVICKNKLISPLETEKPKAKAAKEEFLYFIVPDSDKGELKGKRAIKYDEENSDTKLSNWLKKYKGAYILSDKLDGISCQCYKNNFLTGNACFLDLSASLTIRPVWKDLPVINALAYYASISVTKKEVFIGFTPIINVI